MPGASPPSQVIPALGCSLGLWGQDEPGVGGGGDTSTEGTPPQQGEATVRRLTTFIGPPKL